MRLEPSDDGDGAASKDSAQPYPLWPENWPIWCLWRDVETQWARAGADGVAAGLHYPSVLAVIAQRFRPRQRRLVFWLVQGMEEATLQEHRRAAAERAAQAHTH